MSAALNNGIVKILRRKGAAGKHLLYLAVRLISDGIVRSDALINAKAVLRKAAVSDDLLQIIRRFFRIIQAAVGSHDPTVAAHGQEVLNIIQIIDELIPRSNGAKGEPAEGPVRSGRLKGLRRDVLCVGMIMALYIRHQMLPQIVMKYGQLLHGSGKALRLIFCVKRSADHDQRRYIAGLNHV